MKKITLLVAVLFFGVSSLHASAGRLCSKRLDGKHSADYMVMWSKSDLYDVSKRNWFQGSSIPVVFSNPNVDKKDALTILATFGDNDEVYYKCGIYTYYYGKNPQFFKLSKIMGIKSIEHPYIQRVEYRTESVVSACRHVMAKAIRQNRGVIDDSIGWDERKDADWKTVGSLDFFRHYVATVGKTGADSLFSDDAIVATKVRYRDDASGMSRDDRFVFEDLSNKRVRITVLASPELRRAQKLCGKN